MVTSLVALVATGGIQATSALAAPGDFTNYTSGLGSNVVNGIYVIDDTIYAATNGGLSISTDGGTTFTNYTSGLGNNLVRGVYATDDTIYAATNGGLSISTNGGTTFTNYTSGLGSNAVYGVYAIGSTVYAATFGGLSISTDGGTNFTNYTSDLGSNFVNAVYAIDGTPNDTIYAATDGGLSISTNGGTTFTNKTISNGLGSDYVFGVYAIGSTVYAATFGGLSISTNGGTTFTNYTSGLGSNAVYGVYAIGSTVYAATANGLSVSTDGGATFTNKTTTDGLGSNFVTGVYAIGSTVYAATGGGLSISVPPPPAIVPVTLTCDGDVKFYANIDDTIVFDIASPCNLASDSLDGIWNITAEEGPTGYLSRAGSADWWAYAPEFPITATLLDTIDYYGVTYHLEVGDVAANVMLNDYLGYDLVWMGPPTGRPGPLTFSPDTTSPAVTAFDDTPVVGGTPAALAITVRNTGDDTATPTAITASGTGVSVTGDTCGAMAPGATCTVNLEWAPTAAGALTGSALQISYDGGRDDSTTLIATATADPSPTPSPSPVFPSGAPGSVTAVPGVASAAVAWTAPVDTGSYPVSTYQVSATPGGRSCMTSTLTCEVSGLTIGTTYTFTVKALNGAGWSPASSPSNTVTPQAAPKPSILISGSRTGSTIQVDGTTIDLTGTVTPWVKLSDQTSFTEGSARPTITDNAFTWSRKANKKAYVYITHGDVKSNTITIAAR